MVAVGVRAGPAWGAALIRSASQDGLPGKACSAWGKRRLKGIHHGSHNVMNVVFTERDHVDAAQRTVILVKKYQ